jgi:UDP-N-acetylmuramoyl-L-alanyl-D-glutamate--2,6-diaminopimelate ligase
VKLLELTQALPFHEILSSQDAEITNLQFDSRQVKSGSLFIAVKGTQSDGHAFIDKAVNQGASAIICENAPPDLVDRIPIVIVPDSARALGLLASHFYGNPSNRLVLVGVTGTNGKTTTATLLFRIFRRLGQSVGLLSTIRNQINDVEIPSTHTTPDAIQINNLMHQMVSAGCTYCFMEVTSHAIHQHRIAGLNFDGGIFTNFTQDHLDYHETMDEYFSVKKSWFDSLPLSSFALSNLDDEKGKAMLADTKSRRASYAIDSEADFRAFIANLNKIGMVINVNGTLVQTKLVGRFNAYNILAAYGAAVLLKESPERTLEAIANVEPVEGRLDRVNGKRNISGIVDFAHTPDALENVLQVINEQRQEGQRVISIVGCGGDRDKSKRPKMAAVAQRLSNTLILTSDNPRTENPLAIIEDMVAGLAKDTETVVRVEPERRNAIRLAADLAEPGDIILLAGKGHEKYQEINGAKHPFDDKSELQKAIC